MCPNLAEWPIAGRAKQVDNLARTWMTTYEPTGNPPPVAMTSPWMPASDEEILWAFIDTAPVALMAADDARHILRVNTRWSHLTGYEADAATALRIDDLLAPESRPGIEMRWSDLL